MKTNISEPKRNILYLSVLASPSVLEEVRCICPSFSSYAVHKFNRLVAEGLCANGVNVTSLSSFFIPSKLLWKHKREEIRGVIYKYIPSINFGPIRHIWLIVYCFFYVLIWGMTKCREKAIICDVLNISSCIGAVTAARLLRLCRVGIMTDMPGLMVDRSEKKASNSHASFNARMNKSFLSHFTHYVFLTEQMNKEINVKNRPYIVMEGLVDADLSLPENNIKNEKRVVLYAGGLHERYGLKLLVEGFMLANVYNTELWLYGSGPFVEEIVVYNQKDSRIIYKGIRPNNEVIEAELKATLLVNPRPTHEEFTKYSFPSKNVEYMVSGTPILTTILPGMPQEYHPHVYLFDSGETIEGYAKALQYVLTRPQDELNIKGKEARQWVIENKNHIKQTTRIISLINE